MLSATQSFLHAFSVLCCSSGSVDNGAGVMSIMFLYYSEEQTVKGSEVQAHTMDTNLISTGEFGMKFPSVQEHMSISCQDEFFKVRI